MRMEQGRETSEGMVMCLFRKWFGPRQRGATIRRRPSSRPTLEVLEDRCAPAVLTVNSLADTTAAGSALTLREAVMVVDGNLGRSLNAAEQAQVTGTLGSNDTIQFNLPVGPQTITLTGGALNITKPVSINGPGASSLTINGNGLDRVFVVGTVWSKQISLVASISGLTITGGKQTYGAGIINFGTLTINNCVISNNAAGSTGGGGIYNVGAVTANNTTLSGNSTGASTDGGGLYNYTLATATFTNCAFNNNVAGGSGSTGSQGGGAFNSGTITLTGCTFNANTAGSDSGGFFTNGTATITFCSFTNNVSGADGGALHATGATIISDCLVAGNSASSSGGGMEQSNVSGAVPNSLVMTNTTFVNNTAYGTAGGFVNYLSGVTLTNDTFTGNHSESTGGGIWSANAFTLQNSIVVGNFEYSTPNDIGGTLKSGSSNNLIGTGGAGGLTNGTNGNLVGVTSPGLGTLANNGGPTQTIALLPGSPAIGAGSTAFVTAGATDQRGFPRIVNGAVDIGAFEVQGPPASTFVVSGFPSSVTAGASGTITVTAKTSTGAIATTYTGTVHFTSSDPHAVLPADYTFVPGDNGVHTFNVTFKTAGSQSITATDAGNASITVVQSGITVTPASASTFSVTGPSSTTAGTAIAFTITARDAFGNVATGYLGTVHFTSSDAKAVLPADYTFVSGDSGVRTFSAVFNTQGSQTLTATDTHTSSIAGTVAAVTVNPAATPAVLTVNSTADNTTADNVLTLREAIDVVDGTLGRSLTAAEQAQITGTIGANASIQFNLPTGPQTITLTGGTLSITKPVSIVGPGASNLTISGNNTVGDFYVGSGFSQNLSLVVAISGLTIANGNVAYGAGLFNSGTLTVSNTTFANNTATNNGGGGLYNNGALTLNNSTFTNDTTNPGSNGATAGGGLFNASAGLATVTNSTFTGNTAGGAGSLAGSGGAIGNSGTMTITNSTVNGNTATSDGGAIYSDGTLTLTNDTIANNVALADGGAIRAGGTLTVNASTFSGNSATATGGALDISGTTLSVINSTFANNVAASEGGAIYIETDSGATTLTNSTITANRVTSGSGGIFGGGIFAGVPTTLNNTIIAGNFQGAAPSTTANDIYGTVNSASADNLIGAGGAGGLTNGVNGNLVGVTNPGLGTLASNGGPTQTVALLTGSPAIAHGSNAFVTAGETDQRGLPRIVNGTVDIGAFEVQGTTASLFVVTGFPSSVQAGTAGTITVTVETSTGAVVTSYTGTVHFTSSDPQAVLPADYTFVSGDNGVHTFNIALKTAGSQSVTATDTIGIALTGAQSGIVVTPAAASTIAVVGLPSPSTAGVAGSFTVSARDVYGNIASGYRGTIAFTSTDSQAVLPTSYTFVAGDNGVHTFSATLKTAGSQSITATDAANGFVGVDSAIQVNPASASSFIVTGFPSPIQTGATGTFTVTAKDAFNNNATGYLGTVHFTSTDPKAALPAAYTFVAGDNGAHTFSASFQTTGAQGLTATDQTVTAITGAQSGITVIASAAVPTLTVNSTADTTTADNFLTLREAIEIVDGTLGRALTAGEQAQISGPPLGANDVIQFNLPAGSQTITLTGGALNITQSVTINGPGAANLTINGNNLDRLFYIGAGFSAGLGLVVGMSGLTITGGTQAYGSGIFNSSTLTISNTAFTNNTATTNGGGGIYNTGALTLNNCTFSNNTTLPGNDGATAGGALLNFSTASATLTNCTFTSNTAPGTGNAAGSGGAISNEGTITITGGAFLNNTCGSDGGALYNDGIMTVTNVTLSGNIALADGGAIRAGNDSGNSTLTMTGCTFANNFATSEGGGIDSTYSILVTISNSTFVGNVAGSIGGGIGSDVYDSTQIFLTNDTFTGNRVNTVNIFDGGGGIYVQNHVFLQNTIIAGNFGGNAPSTTPNDIFGSPVNAASANNLIGTGGAPGLTNGVNGNQVGVTNPGLGTLADNGGPTQTVALLPGSPALGAGSTAFVTAGETDQRGLPRVVNGAVDIGAFEVQPVQAPSTAAAAVSIAAALPAFQAGATDTITVTALTATSAVATGYTGTVHFTSSDPQAVLPADYTFVAGDHGVHTFTVTLKTAGAQSITATDTLVPTFVATQSALAVTPAAASTFTVAGFQNPTTAGSAGTFTVTAHDAFGNIATGYLGAVHFTSNDSQAVLPGNYTFVAGDNGVHTFSATLKTAGSQKITATDATTGITGTHTAIGVNPASASTLVVTGFPSSTVAGAAGTFTVTAKDTFGNTATGYLGAIHFTSSDAHAVLPAAYTFVSGDNGVHSFSATFKTTGTQTLSVTDSTIAGTQAGITVTPAAFSTFTVAGFPSPTTAGVAGTFTVTALDSLGNIATGYVGTVRFTSTDAQAVLPASYTFVAGDNGVHTFTATLKTAGSQSISAIDTSSGVTGTHSAITVNPASASTLSVTGYPTPTQAGTSGTFTVTAKDPFGNIATGYVGTVHFTSSDSQAVLPADYTFVSGNGGVHSFSATLQTAGAQSLTVTDKTAASITGTLSGITVTSSVPTLTVNSTADTTTANNFLTLREAIAIVDGTLGRALTTGEQAQISGTLGANDVIQFNLPAGPQTITLTGGALDITKPVTINGPGAANLTINGNNKDRVFIIGQLWTPNLSLVASISGLTITGGNQIWGAGLSNFGTLTVNNTTFANNTANLNDGGGLFNIGALTLNSCSFTGNTVSTFAAGGALENYTSATATINNCSFTSNVAGGSGASASSGGAIGNSGTMTITGSNFTSNTAASDGGAIYNNGKLTISTSNFVNNSSASDGGAIRSGGSTLTISACAFAINSAAADGGALDVSDTTTNVTNSTFANNTAVSEGGGVFADSNNSTFNNCTITANRAKSSTSGVGGGLMAFGTVTLHNTIVAGNFRGASPSTTADDIGAALSSASSFNLIGTGGAGGLVNGVNNNQVGVANPGLGALANNGGPTLTIALLAGSSAIDHGSNTFVVAGETDERGLTRIVNGTVDIGAYEAQ